ncbi:MAG: virulence associated protein, partial [Labilithrix sp.]|nr:virulence associated protein [Labilithrix sp.]
MRSLRPRFLVPLVTSLAVASGVVLIGACGADEVATGVTPGGGADAAPRDDAATPVFDGATAADAAVDAPPVACPDVLPSEADAVFVTASGDDGASCGTRAAPCKTITAALTRAKAAGRAKVHVGKGTYAERVALRAGIEIVGGWEVSGGAWKRGCTNPGQLTVVKAPAAQNVTVDAQDLGGEAKLTLVRIESKDAGQVVAGESLYGVRAVGATTLLTLTDVTVAVAAGGNGTSPAKADNGAAGAAACPPGSGAAGAGGVSGAGAPAGSFDATGYVAQAATAGAAGAPGGNGAAGGPGTCVACGTCLAAPLCSFLPSASTCGTAGTSGCGGGGGGGGAPGTSGGSSVGVFAWDATVVMSGGAASAGDGG